MLVTRPLGASRAAVFFGSVSLVRAAALGMVVVLCACADPNGVFDGGQPAPPEPRPCLTLSDAVDFGEGPRGFELEKTLTVFNPTRSYDIEVSSSISGPPFSTPFPARQLIPPRATVLVSLRFTAPDARLHVGHFSFMGGPGCPIQDVELRGLGEGSLELDTEEIDFGFVPIGQTATRLVHLRNSRRVPVALSFAGPPSLVLTAPVTVIGPSSALELPLSVTPRAGDVFAGTLRITGFHEVGGQQLPVDQLAVLVRGTAGVPVVTVAPRTFDLEHVPLNGYLDRTVLVRNDGDAPSRLEVRFEGGDAGFDGPVVAINLENTADFLVQPQNPVGVVMQLRASRTGTSTSLLTVVTDDQTTPEQGITVTANGEQLSACPGPLQVSPQNVVWPVPVYPAELTFTFTNPYFTDCLVDDVHGSNPGWVLRAGERDQVIVPAMGTATRTLVIPGPGMGSLDWATYLGLPHHQRTTVRLGP